VRKHWAR